MNPKPRAEAAWREGMDFFRYALPMSGGGNRKGILVRLDKPDGTVGWGDAAPLPGWSIETVDAVEAFIKAGKSEDEAPASLVFALESARAAIPTVAIMATMDIFRIRRSFRIASIPYFTA